MLKAYFKDLFQTAQTGDAREESFYRDLSNLLENYADQNDREKIHVTTLPKRTEAGNPDFRVWDGKQKITGYIEAKKPSVDNLNQIENSEQLNRYRNTFPNLILTNFFEFRLYRDGKLIDKVSTGRPFVLIELNEPPPVENQDEFLKLMDKFFSFSLPKTYSAESLAVELAKRTRFLRDEVLKEELKYKAEKSQLHAFHKAFQEYLIGGISEEEFADLYAQTITYGLFAARSRSEYEFNRKLAYDKIPRTIGILRDIFRYISMEEIPEQMEWVVDDISEVLATADVTQILREYFHEGKGSDPIIHFYETFLAKYDPETREQRGVYYTPEPVVSYIVRSVNHILKEYFDREDGLATSSVKVLDPAAGTLTFIAKAIQLATGEFTQKYGGGAKEGLIKDHILENYYAFELMMAPYAVGHLKMSFLLEEYGYQLQRDERFKLYLTNTLEMEELEEKELPLMPSLSKESHLAQEVKEETPILVIIGNPPYSGHSANIGEWIQRSLKEGYTKEDGTERQGYYEVDGETLGERNPKWLQDDYVKFIRFGQWKIDQAGEGVLGFITNHSYLDNPTFRGMRQSLMKTFDQIYFLDLHGNSLKREKCPDGSKDENVFDIRQGVAIALFVKNGDLAHKIYHSDVWGLRDEKYEWLLDNSVKTTDWEEINPISKFYLFKPRDEELLERYKTYPKVTEIFPVNSVGIVTSRDSFVIDFDKEALKRRIRMFRNPDLPDDIIRETFGLRDNRDWKMSEKRKKIIEDENWEEKITKVMYKTFDKRWIFYHYHAIDFGREEVMRHMMQDNLGLVTSRQAQNGFRHALITDEIANLNLTGTAGKFGSGYIFPLYLYPNLKKDNLFAHRVNDGKVPNIKEQLFDQIMERYSENISPEQILYYSYVILYSTIYRTKYTEFLKTDFPRIPFTQDYKLFKEMGAFGEQLIELHLLKSKGLTPPIARFQGKGSNRVAKSKRVGRNYKPEEKRVYINKDGQYFEGIEPEVWEYQIGGYQVLDKWLKDRRERELSLEEIKHYCKVVTALQKTIEIQERIDEIYPGVEEKTVDFSAESA